MKKLFLFIFAMLSMTITCHASQFSDVPDSHWANSVIEELTEKGVVNGVGDGRYDPNGLLTRSQYIKLLVCALDDYDADTQYPEIFADTPSDAWYTPYVTSGAFSGITGADTFFYPEEAMTRGEAAVWMVNGMGIKSNAKLPFSDVTGEAQKTAVAAATKYGLITGYDDGTYKPDNTLTRAEAAALISRMIHKKESFSKLRENSTNEVVFKDTVTYVEVGEKNIISAVDSSKKTITFKYPDNVVKELAKGDVIYIPKTEKYNEFIVKVSDVKASGSAMTVTCEQPKISDFIESIDISTIVSPDADDFKLESGKGRVSNVGGVSGLEPEKDENSYSNFEADADGYVDGDIKKGKLKWVASGTAKGNGLIHYETESFKEKKGAYASLDMHLDLLVDILLSGENFDTNVFAHASAITSSSVTFGYGNSADNTLEFDLPEVDIPVAGPVKIGVTLSVAVHASGEIDVSSTTTINTNNGILFSDGLLETWDDPEVIPEFRANAEGTFEIAPKVDLELKISCAEALFDDLGLVSLEAESGLGINGKVDVEQELNISKDGVEYTGNQNEPDENGVVHDCYACFYGDAYLYAIFGAGLGDDLCEEIKDKYDIELFYESPKYTIPITPWHFSIGGTTWQGPEFKLAKCKHKLYETTITVLDSKTKKPLENVEITIDDEKIETNPCYLKIGARNVAAKLEGYEDYKDSLYISPTRNKIEILMTEIPKLSVTSSNIAEYNGTAYVTDRNPQGLVTLPIQPASYDYICSFAFYKDRLYYSCKTGGTSEIDSAIYSCNPDGSDLKLLINRSYLDGKMATDFVINDDKLYYGNSHTDLAPVYYDLKAGHTVSVNLSEEYKIYYADGSKIFCWKYDKSSKSYKTYVFDTDTKELTPVSSFKEPYYQNYVITENGDIYYVYNQKIICNSQGEETVVFEPGRISNIHAVTNDYIYYSNSEDNIGYLKRLNRHTGAVDILGSHGVAGGGDAFFNW